MSDDERWSAPIGPVDPEHPDCAAVIAEVWTLLDGECTPEGLRERLRIEISRTTIIRRG